VEDCATVGSDRYLTLTLGEALFAISIHSVREILDYLNITRIPHSPDCMQGVVNVRGSAVPVIDLGCKFGLDPVGRTQNTRIVIVELHRDDRVTLAGALADSVREVLEIDPAAIAPPPVSGDGVLRGIVRAGERFVLILDVEKVFPNDAVFDLQEAVAEGLGVARDGNEPGGLEQTAPVDQRSV
jgi:purine-binding chemotaxis protein CheW